MPPSTLKTDRRVTLTFWSVTLIGGGLWLLLINFNLLDQFQPTAQYVLAGVLGILGIGFFAAFLGGREKWWRLIPGWLLLTLAAMVLLSSRPGAIVGGAGVGSTDAADGRLIAAVLFWGMAIAFLHVFLLRRKEYWWSIIPSGFMFVLGGVVAASIAIARLETLGALLSVGMGLVFVLLYAAARAEQGWWPLIPATVLILFGVAAFTTGSEVQNVVLNLWPVLLIGFGAYLGKLAWFNRPSGRESSGRESGMEVHSAGDTFSRQTGRETAASAATGAGREENEQAEGVLGAYTGPAPGTSVDTLDDELPDEAENQGKKQTRGNQAKEQP